VKPRVKAMDEGKLSEEEIRQQIEGGGVKLEEFLTLVDLFDLSWPQTAERTLTVGARP